MEGGGHDDLGVLLDTAPDHIGQRLQRLIRPGSTRSAVGGGSCELATISLLPGARATRRMALAVRTPRVFNHLGRSVTH
jgi:hypothetical protein